MRNQSIELVWITIVVIVVGLGSLVALNFSQRGGMAAGDLGLQTTSIAFSTVEQSVTILSATEDVLSAASPSVEMEETPILIPTSTPTPTPVEIALPPLTLPQVPVPENGQEYLIYPSSPAVVGWVREGDEVANHFGDYNIFAGVFNNQQHIGAVQFNLSEIPVGSPIIYADLTLTGLVDDYLGADGTWSVQMLYDWMDVEWNTHDFYALSRADYGITVLNPSITSAELKAAKANTFVIPPEGLSWLEARTFTKKVSFRIIGPTEGTDSLFAWDSGFGERSFGRAPLLRIVTGGPAPLSPPTPTPHYVIVTPVPTDGAVLLALAAERLTATAVAQPVPVEGTPSPTATRTPFPPNWVTPIIVTNTPTPENQATAIWQAQVATAQAIVLGTATATPPNVWTATPTPQPTPTPLVMPFDLLTPTATATATPDAIPDILRGKILFYSDRFAADQTLMVMDPDGSNVLVWQGDDWVYQRAIKNESVSPGGERKVIVSDRQITSLQLWTVDLTTNFYQQITHLSDISYDPVWSPVDDRIAFVSPYLGNDEIFVINADGTGLTQLTFNQWEWDKHPSWSPDGSQIVFWSNRETQSKQIWIMHADGSNARNISNNEFNDWDPVWVK